MALNINKTQHKAKAQKSLSLTSSAELPFWAAFRMAVIAPPGEGKTHLCTTASAKMESGVLDDIVIVQTDPLGLAGIYEQGIEVPRVIDLSGYTDEEMNGVFGKLPGFLAEEVAKAPTMAVCLDTASVLLGAVCVTEVAKQDGPKAYNEFARRIRNFYSKLRAVPVPVVATMHVRPPRVIMDNKGTFVADSATAAGIKAGSLTMDIEGNKGANVIRGQNTLTARLQREDMPGGKTKWSLKFDSSKDETKTRFTKCLDKVEPADLSLLFKKIAEGCNQPLPGAK